SDLGLALLSEKVEAGQIGRSWTSLQATVGSVSFVGIDGLTIAAENLTAMINMAAADGSVVDYEAAPFTVLTGPDSSLELAMAGSDGELIEVRGQLEIDLFGFFQVAGDFALRKSDETVTLADGSTVSVESLTIGASGVDAFIGLNGGTAEA